MSSSNYTSDEDCTMSPSPPTISIPNSPDSTCRVEILEQPLKKIRFRYLSELQGTPHGPVLGERSSKNHKTYPKARLVGYDAGKNETIKMRCWLVDRPNQTRGHERPHCHNLVVRRCNPKPGDIVVEPHEVVISRDNNYTAEFENMVVLHSVQKNLEKQYMDKTTKWTYRVSSPTHVLSEFSDQSELSSPDKKRMRETIKSINKNEVYLYFEAFVELRNSVVVLASAISNPIRNLKNPVSGDLKICKVVNSFGTCDGDTEVCLFVEKVPQDIKVKFYNDNWTEYISPDIIHRNFAVSFRTPKFDFGIEEDTRVQFCLYRESDGCESNPMEFTYRPSEYSLNCNRKRKRINNSIVPSPQPSTLNTIMFGNGNSQDVDMPIKREIDLNTQVFTDEEEDLDIDISVPLCCDPVSILNEANDLPTSSMEFNSLTSLEAALGVPVEFVLEQEIDGISPFEVDGPSNLRIPRAQMMSDDIVCPPNFWKPGRAKVRYIRPVKNPASRKFTLRQIVTNILLTERFKDHVNCLQEAVMKNQIQVLAKLLSAIKDCSKLSKNPQLFENIKKIRNGNHQTLLHTAILYVQPKSCEIICKLLEFGYDPMLKDKEGNTAFHLAAKKSTCCFLKALVNGFKPKNSISEHLTSSNFEGFNILHLAVRGNCYETVKYIVSEKLVNIDSQETNSGDTALHIACRCLYIKIAQLLIANGADKELVNLFNFSPLQTCVLRNDHDMVALLIAAGSDPLQDCLSLSSVQAYDGENGDLSDETSTKESNDTACFNSFALAMDLKMHDILSGKLKNLKLTDEAGDDAPLHSNAPLLSAAEESRLSEILALDENWKLLVEKLDLPELRDALPSAAKFAKPEKILISYLIHNKDKIFEKSNLRSVLIETISKIGLHPEEIFDVEDKK